jgi:hypothetical protein
MPRAKEEALTIVRTNIPQQLPLRLAREAAPTLRRRIAGTSPAAVVARSLAMLAVAAVAILVLLPAAVGAQATLPI